jgi:hypothetical protein
VIANVHVPPQGLVADVERVAVDGVRAVVDLLAMLVERSERPALGEEMKVPLRPRAGAQIHVAPRP